MPLTLLAAKAIVEFLLGDSFQASVPENMYVYPINEAIEVPEAWAKFAHCGQLGWGESLEINANRDQWLTDWSDVFDN